MSEYWKSTPKYWCKHCSAYVRDTPFERRQHESTAKHQSNLKRFLRDIQNNHERAERDKARAKAEVERLNKIAGSGGAPSTCLSKATASAAAPPTKHKGSQLTAEDQKRQWQQLADMGIKVPDQVRTEMAMAGDWQAVRQPSPDVPLEDRLSVGVRKRKADDEEEEEEEEDQLAEAAHSSTKRKVWGKSIKNLPAKEEDELDALLSTSSIPLKTEKQHDVIKKEEQDNTGTSKQQAISCTGQSEDASGHQQCSASAGTRSNTGGAAQAPDTREAEVEESAGKVAPSQGLDSMAEPESSTSTVPFFKKRKAKGKS